MPYPIINGYRQNQARVQRSFASPPGRKVDLQDLLRHPPQELLDTIDSGGIPERAPLPGPEPEFKFDLSRPPGASPRYRSVSFPAGNANANGLQVGYNGSNALGSHAMAYGIPNLKTLGTPLSRGFRMPNMDIGDLPMPDLSRPSAAAGGIPWTPPMGLPRRAPVVPSEEADSGSEFVPGYGRVSSAYLRGVRSAAPQLNRPSSLQTNQQALLAGATPNITVGGAYALNRPAGAGAMPTVQRFRQPDTSPQYVNADGRPVLNDPRTLDDRVARAKAAMAARSPGLLASAPAAAAPPPEAPALSGVAGLAAAGSEGSSEFTRFAPPSLGGMPAATLTGPMTDPEAVAANKARWQQTLAERQRGVQLNAVGREQARDQRIAARNYVPSPMEQYAMRNPQFALQAMSVMGENQARAGQLDLARQGLALNRDKLAADQNMANNQLQLGRDKLLADSQNAQRSHDIAMEQARASFQQMVNQGATQQEAAKQASAHYANTLAQMQAQSAQQQRQFDLSMAQGQQQHAERMKQMDLAREAGTEKLGSPTHLASLNKQLSEMQQNLAAARSVGDMETATQIERDMEGIRGQLGAFGKTQPVSTPAPQLNAPSQLGTAAVNAQRNFGTLKGRELYKTLGPVLDAVAANPNLTREQALQMAAKYGLSIDVLDEFSKYHPTLEYPYISSNYEDSQNGYRRVPGLLHQGRWALGGGESQQDAQLRLNRRASAVRLRKFLSPDAT